MWDIKENDLSNTIESIKIHNKKSLIKFISSKVMLTSSIGKN